MENLDFVIGVFTSYNFGFIKSFQAIINLSVWLGLLLIYVFEDMLHGRDRGREGGNFADLNILMELDNF